MIRLALRNLLARKRRTLLIALAVVVGVAQVTGAFILTDSMNRTVDEIFDEESFDVSVVVSPRGAGQDMLNPPTLDAGLVQRIAAVDGVDGASGDIFGLVPMLDDDGEPLTTGPPSFVTNLTERGSTGLEVLRGRWPRAEGETALDEFTADRAGYAVGDRLTISGDDGVERPRIVGIFAPRDGTSYGGAAVAITTERAAARMTGRDGEYDTIQVDAEQGVSPEQLQTRIRAALEGERVVVRTGEQEARSQAQDLKDQLGFLRPVLLAFAAIALFVGSFVIVNTFSATLAQRSQELALLRALGATRRQVTRSVVLESLLIGVVAGLLGLLAGLLVAPGILAMFRGFGIDLPAQETAILPRTIVVALLIGPIVTGLAGVLPARRAVKVPPVQAMRGETARDEARRPGPLAWLTGALAIAAIAGSLLTSSTTAALLVGAGALLTMIAVALLAPVVLEPVMRVLGAPVARFGQTGRLARLNAMRSPRRTATTAGALMVGVALVVFVAVFAAGIANLARGLFDERVTGQLATLQSNGTQPYPARAHRVIAADPDVRRVVGFTWVEYDRADGGGSVALQGVDPGVQEVYSLNWVDGDDRLLERLGPGDAIADRGATDDRIAGARVGDRFRLERPDGSPLVLTVRGTVDEGNSLLGQSLIVPTDTLAGGGRPQYFNGLIRLREGADLDAAQKRIQAAIDERYPTLDALTKDEFADVFIGQVNQLVNMIYAFLAFALLVSLLGISTTFTLTVQERRRELGMMRAVGATRRQIRSLVRKEAVLTGLLGAALGTAIGLGFGALVARLLRGDGFEYVVPLGTILGVVLLAALVAAIAAALPARRAGKVDVVQAVSAE